MKTQRLFTLMLASALLVGSLESNAFFPFRKRPKTDVLRPEIKYSSKKTFAVKIPTGTFKSLEVEIRDAYDNLVYDTKYENVSNFEKVYNINQLQKGKYFVTIYADGTVYRDMIQVKR